MIPLKCPCCGSLLWDRLDIDPPERTGVELARVILKMFPRLLPRFVRKLLGTRDVIYYCYSCGFEKRYNV